MSLGQVSLGGGSPGGVAAGGAASALTGRAGIANNFDAFLTLLTTQLRNQSPLDPLDSNQFTQQLVQFSSVEQQLRTNETLQALLAASRSNQSLQGLGFVGMDVTALGDTQRLESTGGVRWTINAARGAEARITIRNSAGTVVHSETRALRAGGQSFTWNGTALTGGRAPPGDYTVQVSATDPRGAPVATETEVSGVVDAVEFAGGQIILRIGDFRLSADQVRAIRRGPA